MALHLWLFGQKYNVVYKKKIIIIVTLNVKDKNKDTYRPFHGRIIDPVQYFPKIPIVYI